MKVATMLCTMVMVCTIQAAILHVPGEYPTVQEALVNAAAYDTVLVAAGTYYEHIVWPSTQSIVLMSEYGADSTIIDAISSLRVITINTDIDTTTIINGFTIKNGSADKGGGIYCYNGGPTICNNIISNNQASQAGGGIYCEESRAKIIGNIITANTGADGGGFGCFMCSPTIINNKITENSADGVYGDGGGIFAVDAYEIKISGNNIDNNSANSLSGGIYFYKSYAYIDSNDIIGNTSTGSLGKGIHFNQSGGILHYNNIAGNGYGVSCNGTADTLNAEYNWWGDSTGPYHATNPGGMGDTVSNSIDFMPWLYAPQCIEEQTEYAVYTNSCALKIYPNPARQTFSFEYNLANKCFIDISLYDNAGRCIQHLVKKYQMPGVHRQLFNGAQLSQGVYIVRLTTTDHAELEKFILLK